MVKALLAPAAVLIAWTLLIMLVLVVARARAMTSLDRDKLKQLPRAGGRGVDLDRVLSGRINWIGHNYNHLLEQPTLFYALVAILALAGQVDATAVRLAWAYTAIRIAHSLWQIFVNKVPIRFLIFLLSSACLIWLAVKALMATLA